MSVTAPNLRNRPRFTSASGRTVLFADPAGLADLAEEHEWMREKIARLEAELKAQAGCFQIRKHFRSPRRAAAAV